MRLGSFQLRLLPARLTSCPTQRIRFLHSFARFQHRLWRSHARPLRTPSSRVVPFRRSHAETVHTSCTGCLAVKMPTSSAPVHRWMRGLVVRRLPQCLTPSVAPLVPLSPSPKGTCSKQWERGRLSETRKLNASPVPLTHSRCTGVFSWNERGVCASQFHNRRRPAASQRVTNARCECQRCYS